MSFPAGWIALAAVAALLLGLWLMSAGRAMRLRRGLAGGRRRRGRGLTHPIGKYLGQAVHQIACKDPDYIRWLAEQPESSKGFVKRAVQAARAYITSPRSRPIGAAA
jgi:hypothetical protein